VKKAALSEELLKSLTGSASDEKLDDRLAGLMINDGLPLPSSDEKAWWESEDRPDGRFPTPPPTNRLLPTNPFDDAPSSSSSEDEELYTKALSLPELRLPPPPLPSRASKPS